MMPTNKLFKMIWRNTLRSKGDFALSIIGVAFGILMFVLFLALSKGAEKSLQAVFPADQLEVRPQRATFAMGEKRITDETIKELLSDPRITAAIPRMQLAMPASGVGSFEGESIRLFLESVVDGIAPEALTDERAIAEFKDWDALPMEPCLVKTGKEICPPPHEDGTQASCRVERTYTCADDQRYYCDQKDRKCHRRVPVIMSPAMIEMYNAQFARGNNLPAITGDLGTFIEKRGPKAMRFHITLGVGMNPQDLKARPRKIEAAIVGMDKAAMRIGATMPLAYIKRFRSEFLGPDAAKKYSSVLLTVKNPDEIAPLIKWLEKEHGLTNTSDAAQNVSSAHLIITIILLAISIAIIALSALNIAHSFFSQIAKRRREIGVLRAVGATKTDVLFVILGEAALIGLIGGAVGTALALAIGAILDTLHSSQVADYAFKPESWFDFQWWMILGGLLFAIFFCVLGGFLPARRAANLPPAQALTQ